MWAMPDLYKELALLAFKKGELLRREAELWEKAGKILGEEKPPRILREPEGPAPELDPPLPADGPAYLTIKEAVAYTGMSRSAFYGLRREDDGPKFVRVGARVRYPRDELDRFMKRRMVVC